MKTMQKTTRANFVRQRRLDQKVGAKPVQTVKPAVHRTYASTTAFIPVQPRPVARPSFGQIPGKSTRAASRSAVPNRYDFAFTVGAADVRAPAISIPQLGPRWISGLLTLLLAFLLYTFWTASFFTVTFAEVTGNQRLGTDEINAMLGMLNQPIFRAVPADLESNLRTVFPDLESVQVHVGFPNHIRVAVVERTPLLSWYQDGLQTWIDAHGIAFTPRGDQPGLVAVASNGTPTGIINNPDLAPFDQAFIPPQMVQALTLLAPYVPSGMPMIFDPQYGMGWQDPRGWTVYFGQNTTDMPTKTVVYQSIVDTLTRQGIQPSLINVEYLNAPFYK